MDILFVTLSPIDATFSASFRNRAVIRGFIELGHTVDILTLYPYDKSITVNEAHYSHGVNIIRLNKLGNQNKKDKISLVKKGRNNFLTKIVREMYHRVFPFDSSYFLLKKINVNKIPKERYDIVISSSDPKTSHIAVKKLFDKGLTAEKWIQYWGDPLTLDMTSKLIYPKTLIKKIEFNIIKHADKIIYVSPFTHIEQAKMFRNISEKMTYLPIPYEKEKVFPVTNNQKYIIGYHGFYMKSVRNIIPLYDAVNEMNDKVQLDIIGSSDLYLQSTKNVKVYPNTNKIHEFESNTNLFVVVLNLHGNQIPGKLYHLAATNRPILVILDGEGKDEIRTHLESFERFEFCENETEKIAVAIKRIIKINKHNDPCTAISAKSISESFLC